MNLKVDQNWITTESEKLFEAFLTLNTKEEIAAFCRDLMTEKEISEFAGRFAVAQSLAAGKSQRETSKDTGVSIATVTRVNLWLKRGLDGYKTAISRLNALHHPR